MLHLAKVLAILVVLPGTVGLLAGLLALVIAAALGELDAAPAARPLSVVLTSSAVLAAGLALFAVATILQQIRAVRRALASDFGDGPAGERAEEPP